MSEISRSKLYSKLNSVGYKSIESATVFCKMRGNPYVELVHWIQQIIQLPDSDLKRIVTHFGIDLARLATDMTASLDRLPRGASSISDLSSQIDEATERGWVYGSLMFNDSKIRSGHLMLGMLKTRSLNNSLMAMSTEFQKLKTDELAEKFQSIVGGSPEDTLAAQSSLSNDAAPGETSGAMPTSSGNQEALAQFTVDLTQQARDGEIDPIVGRDEEIRQIIDILMRRRQNNPILTGEAGVGKTAAVEGFALRIASGDVPPPLRGVTLRTLDVGLLQAGASMKGEFENRLKKVIEEVQSSEVPIILFIDEAHTLVGAGGAAGTGDAANLLKPALARGTLRTIAATTWAEYKKHIEKDPALTRRFQLIQILEPSEEKAILMMRAMASSLEKHHKVLLLDEAIEAAVKLSHRYIPARHLPDKSVSLLDTACARVAISQSAMPAEVEDCKRQIEAIENELAIIAREKKVGVDTGKRQADAKALLATQQKRFAELETRWSAEKDLVEKILALRAKLRGDANPVDVAEVAKTFGQPGEQELLASPTTETPKLSASSATDDAESKLLTSSATEADEQRSALLAEMRELLASLATSQGESPLILPSVDTQAVASVVQDWTGIPVGRMVSDEVTMILNLADRLEERIIGQRHAMETIARRIQTSRAQLDNPSKPIGVFMLAGTSGVGKTETALALAEMLYGGEQNLITINMSEFQEAHTVSTLKGSPPGYVGYGEGGVLTEAVRRRPYSVVLLDEIEKAHSDVHEIFFQVFDKGWMEDGEGRKIDFKNTLIILTTNVGTETLMRMCQDANNRPEPEQIATALREPLLREFPAALLGRLVTIPYYPLSADVIGKIARLQLGRIERRVRQNHEIPFTFDDNVIDLIVTRCVELESGGRMIDNLLTNSLLPQMSEQFLRRLTTGQRPTRVHVTANDGTLACEYE